jgi:hypothetical protein
MSEKVKIMNKREDRRDRKLLCIWCWEVLNKLGTLEKEVAFKIGVHRAYFSRVINDKEKEAVLSEAKVRRLEDFMREKIVSIVKDILDLGLVPVEVISTGYSPSTLFTSKQENFIKEDVVDSISLLLAGCQEPPVLPNGICATTVRIGEDRYCEIYAVLIKHNGKNAEQARIHEYDHLVDYFRGQANKLRSGGKRSKHLKKGL